MLAGARIVGVVGDGFVAKAVYLIPKGEGGVRPSSTFFLRDGIDGLGK